MSSHRESSYSLPYYFAPLEFPFAASVGYLQICTPYFLSQKGFSLAQIGAISATGFLPHAWKLLWVPLLDIGHYRRYWLILSALLAMVLLYLVGTIAHPEQSIGLYTLLITLCQAAAATSGAAVNGLMATTVKHEQQGLAGGFQMAGNVGGTAILGVLPIWLSDFWSQQQIMWCLIVLMGLGASVALLIHETPKKDDHKNAAAWSWSLWRPIKNLLIDIWATVKTRSGFLGLLVCAVPVGCGALTNLFSGMTSAFHVDKHTVEMVNGLWGGVVSALGSLMGGYIVSRINRPLAYCLSGALSAMVALLMGLLPLGPTNYIVGCLSYMFFNGMAFACFAGIVLQLVSNKKAATTQYALFVVASNQAISYTTYLDGRASVWFSSLGDRAPLLADACLTFLGITTVALVVFLQKPKPSYNAA